MRKAVTLASLLLAACAERPLPPPPGPPPLTPVAASSASGASTVGSSAAGDDTAATDASSPQVTYAMTPVALPGATGAVSLDYLAVDRAAGKIWVPAGGTGSVDVIDAATKQATRIEGFPTVEREMRGQKRLVGPSSATVGDGVVYVGNRADASVCIVDAQKMQKGACVTLPSAPDGLLYVRTPKEVWATTPRDKAILVLDASVPGKLTQKTKITLPGAPEGYAVDDERGFFFTNLEDKDKTLVIDVGSHTVKSTWEPACGGDGPRGLAVDTTKQLLFVACTDHVEAIDTTRGVIASKLDTGAGVDNIDYVGALGQLFVSAGKDARLTVAAADLHGALTALATSATSQGARVVVADALGNAYVADGMQGRILVLSPSH